MSFRLQVLTVVLVLASTVVSTAQEPPQPLMDRARVNPEDSTEAVRQLRLVDAYIQQGSWGEAVDLLQTMIETYPREVIPVPKAHPARYVSVRSHCHQILSELPDEALKSYRSRVDGQADALLKQFEESGEEKHLQQLVDQYFCSTAGDIAIEKIGDRELALGHIDSAIEWWSKLLPPPDKNGGPRKHLTYPGPKNDLARLWAKWGIAQLLRGRMNEAKGAADVLREKYRNAEGELGGEKGPYWKILQDFGQDTNRTAPALSRPDWKTFAGDYERSKISPTAINIGAIERRWSLAAAAPSEESEGPEFNQIMVPPFQQMVPRASPRNGTYAHPITIGREVLVSDGSYLYWFEVDKDEPVYKFNLNVNNTNANGVSVPLYHHTLTLSGNRLFVRTGSASTQNNIPIGMRPAPASSLLFCFDHPTKKLLWWVNATEADTGPQSVFEGAPVVVGDNVYIGVTRLDAMSTTHIVCLEADSGKVQWKRLVCEASSDWTFPLNPDQNMLTLGDDTLYYGTNLGAVAALHLPTQKIKWLAEYTSNLPTGAKVSTPEVNPCVYHQGKVFFAPIGTNMVFCFDSQTGETIWQNRIPAEHVLGVAKGFLIVTGNRVYALNVNDGQLAWQFPENQPKGVGRGMLAGDFVYWPTTAEIHVLDQATGLRAAPPISLLDGLRTKPGNLVAGDGFALLAQNRSVLLLRPHTWLQKKQEEYLAMRPDSAEAHLLYANASAAADDMPSAVKHYEKAIELAKPRQVIEGLSLSEVAKDRLVRAIIGNVKSQTAGEAVNNPKVVEAAQADLRKAMRHASTPNLEWLVYQQKLALAETVSTKGGDASKSSLLTTLDEILADESMGDFLITDTQGHRECVRDYLTNKYQRSVISDDLSILWNKTPSDDQKLSAFQLLRFVRQHPFAKDRVPFLSSRLQETIKSQQYSDALQIGDEILSAHDLDSSQRLTTLLAVESIYRSLELERSRSQILAELSTTFGSSAFDPSTSVAQYVASTSKSTNRRGTQPLTPKWTMKSGVSQLIVPEGDAPSRRLAGVAVLQSSRENDLVTLQYCRLATGRKEWSDLLTDGLESIKHSNAGLLLIGHNKITCRAYGNGKVLWTATHRSSQRTSPTWASQKSSIQDGFSEGATASFQAAEKRHKLIITPNRIFNLDNNGWIRCLDLFDGKTIWEGHPLLMKGLESTGVREQTLQVLKNAIVYSTPERLFVLDPSGKVKWECPLLDRVGTRSVVERQGILIALTRRNQITAFDELTGKIIWTHETATPAWGAPHLFEKNGIILCLFDSYRLSRLEPTTGKSIWEVPLTQSPNPSLHEKCSISQGYFVVTNRDSIDCRSLETGELTWQAKGNDISSTRIDEQSIEAFVPSPSGSRFVRWNLPDGKKWESAPMPIDGATNVIWTSDGAVLRTDNGAMGFARESVGQEK
ncbi:PQQ-binding-like beta-propeller repeat protein [bacterium]|nr:PQQ-binding-like beta-propeller repeat protein [bacterium]